MLRSLTQSDLNFLRALAVAAHLLFNFFKATLVMKMFKALFLAVLIAAPTLMLSGCGTLDRGMSYESTYRGFDRDKTVGSHAFLWMATLGIMPVFYIVSMPVDLVMDTILLPWDLYSSRDRRAPAPLVTPFPAEKNNSNATQKILNTQAKKEITPRAEAPQ